MYVVNATQMRAIDRYTIDVLGIPGIVLMENAGREVARVIQEKYRDIQKWLVLAGKGNNGGDGLVIARHLSEAGFDVHILFAEPPDHLVGEAAIQRDIVTKLDLKSSIFQPDATDWQAFEGIIDALLGTGSKGAPREPYATMILEANGSCLPTVAVDIPSGLDADTGNVNKPCIHADHTVSLAFLKRGLTQYPGVSVAGQVHVVPIGIPNVVAKIFSVQTFFLNPFELSNRLQIHDMLRRKPDTHKGTYGHALLIAGSRQMSGAGLLCTRAALRSGCGLVTWAMPDALSRHIVGHIPEAMLAGLPDEGRGDWQTVTAESILALADGKDAAAIGPGLGKFENGERLLRELWESIACPLVVDADGLNLLANDFTNWPKRKASTIFTPHPGEMARLTNLTTKELQADRITIAKAFAEVHNIFLVLKGAHSVIATPAGEIFINSTGNPGMATGGTGDVLTGIITSLLAQGWNAAQATCFGTYLHGQAGDYAAKDKGYNGLLASDIIDNVGQVIKEWE